MLCRIKPETITEDGEIHLTGWYWFIRPF